MATFPKPVTPTWGGLRDLDTHTYNRLRSASSDATQLARCGGGRDAVVIEPLHRGLAALDAMGLPVEDGHAVIADHLRQELIVLVAGGRADTWAGVPGVRLLSRGSWLLVPERGTDGSIAAVWLSEPARRFSWADWSWASRDCQPSLERVPVTIDVADLREAVVTVDARVLSAGARP